jgi:phenylacetate-CoA ligase
MRQDCHIWDKEYECLPRKDMQRLQLHRLQQTVERVYSTVEPYRRQFGEAGISPADIRSLDDIRRLPFTTKGLLRDNYPYGLFAAPMREIVRLHASSGTTGKPTVVGYTRKDLETWSELVARLAVQAGVVADDIAQVTFGYGLFTGAFGLHYGLEKVGAAVVPASAGNTEKQLALMQDFATTVLIGTPSYALHMADVAKSLGMDPAGMKLRLGLFGAEAWTEEIRGKIEEKWGIRATDNYGLSEIIGPGVAGECTYCRGLMHVSEDHFFVEVINPDTGEPVEYGEKGELVITTLTKEALPLIRYRTRDYTTLIDDPCVCGRTTVRMTKVAGRSDDMLIVSGVNVFPSQIESVLLNTTGLQPYYQIVLKKSGQLDHIEVQVELAQEYFVDDYRELERLEEHVKNKLYQVLSIRPHVKLLKPNSLERKEGKAVRVVDQRR